MNTYVLQRALSGSRACNGLCVKPSAHGAEHLPGIGGDGFDGALSDQAVVRKGWKFSTSCIRRKRGIGYHNAVRLMKENHVITTAKPVGKRETSLPQH
jgi:DNA segregation ATPase FtsK/SpoIIIE-like protein